MKAKYLDEIPTATFYLMCLECFASQVLYILYYISFF